MTFVRILLALAVAGATASTARAASIDCGSAIGIPGGKATVEVRLTAGDGEVVAGTQNDLQFDDSLLGITPSDCRINPEIGPGSEAAKSLATNVLVGPPTVRNIIVATADQNPIPDGLLYTCTFTVAADAPLGSIELANTKLIASDADGQPLPATGTSCALTIAEATPTETPVSTGTPTVTPTATPPCTNDAECPSGEVCVDGTCVTPTPTPPGFCTDDTDCQPGESCVDNRCVTPTPTPPGFCTDDTDCQPGESCIDNRCVTPTPTPPGFCTDDTDCQPGRVLRRQPLRHPHPDGHPGRRLHRRCGLSAGRGVCGEPLCDTDADADTGGLLHGQYGLSGGRGVCGEPLCDTDADADAGGFLHGRHGLSGGRRLHRQHLRHPDTGRRWGWRLQLPDRSEHARRRRARCPGLPDAVPVAVAQPALAAPRHRSLNGNLARAGVVPFQCASSPRLGRSRRPARVGKRPAPPGPGNAQVFR